MGVVAATNVSRDGDVGKEPILPDRADKDVVIHGPENVSRLCEACKSVSDLSPPSPSHMLLGLPTVKAWEPLVATVGFSRPSPSPSDGSNTVLSGISTHLTMPSKLEFTVHPPEQRRKSRGILPDGMRSP